MLTKHLRIYWMTTRMAEDSKLHLTVYFGGGADILFDGVKMQDITLPLDEEKWTLGRLIFWMRDNRLKGNPDLFVKGDSVRPGILVLVNDTDWDLLGQHDYILQDKDQVHFISTLHGG